MDTLTTTKEWSSLMDRAGIQLNREKAFLMLYRQYAEGCRYYHDLGHIGNMLRGFESLKHLALSPIEVELAIWFHDAVYETNRGDNEERSAELAKEWLAKMGYPKPDSEYVAKLIMATKHKRMPESIDEQIIADLDLASLASDPEVFDANTEKIRAEYGWVGDIGWKHGRAAFVKSMLPPERKQIFSLPVMRERCEARARVNLERSLKKFED